jgi:hypothetical protein
MPITACFGQRRGRVQQPPGLGGAEQERQPGRGDPPPRDSQRRDGDEVIDGGPVQQAAQHAAQVVETARPGPGPRCQERLDDRRGEVRHRDRAAGAGEPGQQRQLSFLADVLAADRPLVRDEPGGR